jgi:hypothetical protein
LPNCQARLPSQDAKPGCQGRLPSQAAKAGCQARLPGQAAGQGCRTKLPDKAARQGCQTRLPDKAARPGKAATTSTISTQYIAVNIKVEVRTRLQTNKKALISWVIYILVCMIV